MPVLQRPAPRASESLAAEGIRVAALWVDDEEKTRAIVQKHRIGFPLGHDADAAALSAATGAFVDAEACYRQSTGFVLDPAGRVVVSVYSSGAIGRLVPEDVLGLVRYTKEHVAA